ncbi:type II toxin-antitoxin system RelE family toxin [Methanolacinia petrolearia]|uniref:type II toxin-antitoxin system RelE family toxin n=1 Tax=Methanolacinia petrolearia TaxID=54120 RepID=UPI003BABA9FD
MKDLSKIPNPVQKRIEELVFNEMPESDDIFSEFDIRRMKGMPGFFRIRQGRYRIGFEITDDNKIIFYRVKSREEIYSVFP